MGDIAVPGVDYSEQKKKDRRAYAEKVEKYKKEINEGLQIEEEGIVPAGTTKAIDVAQIKIRHRHNNRTRKNHQNKRKNDDHPDKTVVDNSLSRYPYNFIHLKDYIHYIYIKYNCIAIACYTSFLFLCYCLYYNRKHITPYRMYF